MTGEVQPARRTCHAHESAVARRRNERDGRDVGDRDRHLEARPIETGSGAAL
jgi:hypothetical protein